MSEENKSILENIEEVNKSNFVEEMLKNNFFEFEYKGNKYRIKKPSLRIRNEANEKRAEKYKDLIKDPKYRFEDDLKKEYKTKGIDIDEFQSIILNLENKKVIYQMKIGEELKKETPSQPVLETYRKEISDIQEEMLDISFKKNSLLEFSIENQLTIFSYSYLTYLMLEKQIITKKEDGTEEITFKRAFDTYDDFLDSEEGLVNKSALFSTFVLRQNE